MADQLPETTNFGLTRMGNGETLAKNGYSFGDLDRVKLDRLLLAALTHTHSGGLAVGDPSDPPTFVVSPTGGHLSAATTYYYRIAYVDKHGLESAASPEGSVYTGDPISPGTAPGGTPAGTGGTLGSGIYSYVYTYVDAYGGETTPSPLNNISINPDTTGTTAASSSITLDFPDLPVNAISYRIYRSRPGQSNFYLLGTFTPAVGSTTYLDDGVVEDQTITAPTVNTTSANNSIQLTVPGGFIPPEVIAWRIYRATSSGGYDGTSLVKEVTESSTLSGTTLTTDFVDTGDALESGFPLNTSSTVPPGSLLTLNQVAGQLPLGTTARGAQVLSAFFPGVVADGSTVLVTETPGGMNPVRMTAHFKTPPTDAGVTVQYTVADAASHSVTLDCGAPHHGGSDPAGYFHREFPLIAAAKAEAEIGTISDPTTVIIDDDPTASNTQAVQLAANGDYVQNHFGTLDAGTYRFYVTVRVVTYDTSLTDDLVVQVMDGASTAVATQNFTLNTTTNVLYQEIGPITFVSDGTVDLGLRVSKATASGQITDVDFVRYTADTTQLDSGLLTITCAVTSGTSSGADVNFVIWF